MLAPCQNYAQVNAYADRTKRNAQYLPNVGTLIKEINKIQSSREIRQVQVLFLSENVVFKGSESVWPYYGISEVGLRPVRMDGKSRVNMHESLCVSQKIYTYQILFQILQSVQQKTSHHKQETDSFGPTFHLTPLTR